MCAAFCAVLGGVASQASAQTTAPAQTRIVPPTAIYNTQSLNFGKVVAGTTQTRLTINADTGVMTRTGNAIPAGGTVSRGRFQVVSQPLLAILIQPPSGTITLNRVGGGASMPVDNFTINGGTNIFGIASRSLLLNGTLNFDIGGRLTIAPNQMQGHYQGTYNVTVTFL